MNRIATIIFITLSLLLAALFSGTDPSYSCLGIISDYEKYRISYVDPDLFPDSTYQSFYRTILQEHQAADNYWEIPHEEFHQLDVRINEIREKENVREWSGYFGGNVSARSIYDLIYRSDNEMIERILIALAKGKRPAVGDSIVQADSKGETPDTLHFGEGLRYVVRQYDTPFLRYLHFANECAPWVGASGNLWGEPQPSPPLPDSDSLIRKGLALHDAAPSDFLKLRYAYQLVRLTRYGGDHQQAFKFYDSLIAPNPQRSSIRFRALSHKGGSARLMGYTLLSNYYFSQVFDSCEGEREIALRDFTVGSDKEWDDLYRLAKNDHERATLRMMKGFKAKGLTFDYIREMHDLEPRSPRLAVALLRELHRVESYLYDYMETRHDTARPVKRLFPYGRSWDSVIYYADPDSVADSGAGKKGIPIRRALSGRDYVTAFRSFILEIVSAGKVLEPALWYMTAGYLDIMDNDWEMAEECLSEAGRSVAGNRELSRQIELLARLKEIKTGKRIDEAFEAEVNGTLRWFREKQRRNRHTKYDKAMAALGQNYLLQDDVPKAILAFNAAHDSLTRNLLLDMYATQGDLQALQEMVERGGSTDFERLLIDSFPLRRPDLLDLRGTRLMRLGEFRKGLHLLRQIPPSYWNLLPPVNQYGYEPVNFRKFRSSTETASMGGLSLVASEEWYGYTPDSLLESRRDIRHYTRLSFAQTAVGLLDRAERETGPGAGSAYYRLARLLYNTPYWGYADGLWRGEFIWQMRFYYPGPGGYPFNIPELAERMEQAQMQFMAEYGSRRLAREYFRRAMQETQDRELAATCAYMMDLCANRQLTSLHPVPEIAERDRTGYLLLTTKYRDTYFAGDVLSTCSIYKSFEQ